MSEEFKDQTNTDTCLYTPRSILTATFFGTPLAAGILLRKNFIKLGRIKAGKISLLSCIAFTLLIFITTLLIPDEIMSKIPGVLVSALYTSVVSLIITFFQKDDLVKHGKSGGSFYPAWRGLRTGVASLIIAFLLVFSAAVAYEFMIPSMSEEDINRYNAKMDSLQYNEGKALELYTYLDNNQYSQVFGVQGR